MNRLPKVLFVDDEQKILKMFEEFFSYSKSPKIECVTSVDPNSVVSLVENHTFDVIFLDFLFKDSEKSLNGVDIIQKLRNKFDKLPKIILLTGVADIAVAVDSIKNGAADVLIKPIDLEKIKKVVLECYFENSSDNKMVESVGQLISTEKNGAEFTMDDLFYVNSLHKFDEIFKYVSTKMIDNVSSDFYIMVGIKHAMEGFSTIFFKGNKSISEKTIDAILVDATGKPRYSGTKFLNFSPINSKNNEENLMKVYEYTDSDYFVLLYGSEKISCSYERLVSIFTSSIVRIVNIEKELKIMMEKVVEGSSFDFSNIIYKEVE